jgi:hypothetical protein
VQHAGQLTQPPTRRIGPPDHGGNVGGVCWNRW